jgi:hypothetical protein
VEAHPRYAGQQDSGGEKKYEERHSHDLDRYYDAVSRQLTEADELFIFGPGDAKLELKERLRRSKAHSERSIGIETADKLTDPQIVAKVKEHFGIAR